MQSDVFFSKELSSTATKIAILEKDKLITILIATWNGKLQYVTLDVDRKQLGQMQTIDVTNNEFIPVLALCSFNNIIYCSSEDEKGKGVIKVFEMVSETLKEIRTFGHHEKAINQIVAIDEKRLLTLSYDKQCILWDIEISPKKIHQLSLSGVATAIDKRITDGKCELIFVLDQSEIFLVDDFDFLEFKRLEFNERLPTITSIAIDFHQKSLDFWIGTACGRVAHCRNRENIYKLGSTLKYGLEQFNQVEAIFPITSLMCFTGIDEIFISGGAHGKVTIFDTLKLVETKNFFDDTVPVSCIKDAACGNFLVIAKGYGFHQNEKMILTNEGSNKPKIIIYEIQPKDIDLSFEL